MPKLPSTDWRIRRIEWLYRRFGRPLVAFLIKRNGHSLEEAEDILQETMIAALKGLAKFQNKCNYFTWLCKIALNKSADYYRRCIHENSRLVIPLIEELDSLINPTATPEEKLLLGELRFKIRHCINLLPEEYRRLINLRYYSELTYKQIGKIVGSSERSVEGKLYRAKKQLQQILASRYPEMVPEKVILEKQNPKSISPQE